MFLIIGHFYLKIFLSEILFKKKVKVSNLVKQNVTSSNVSALGLARMKIIRTTAIHTVINC